MPRRPTASASVPVAKLILLHAEKRILGTRTATSYRSQIRPFGVTGKASAMCVMGNQISWSRSGGGVQVVVGIIYRRNLVKQRASSSLHPTAFHSYSVLPNFHWRLVKSKRDAEQAAIRRQYRTTTINQGNFLLPKQDVCYPRPYA